MSVVLTTSSNAAPRCKGCWVLGNNCGQCDHCLATATNAILEIRRSHDEVYALKREIERLNKQIESMRLSYVINVAPLNEYRREYPKMKLRANIAEAEAKGLREALAQALVQISDLEARCATDSTS